MSKVAQLKDDLAYALAATDIRILAPIPGKTAVGVEVPNHRRKIVQLGDVFTTAPADWSPLTVWLGKDVAGKAIGADLAKMPHLLVAGTTGAGKSACINAMLSSVLLRATPHEVRARPRRPQAGRAQPLRGHPAPAHAGHHEPADGRQRAPEPRQGDGGRATRSCRWPGRAACPSSTATAPSAATQPLPYILCVIDELADLMMVAPADVEDSIIRLAQKARAVGIHLVLATQSPRVDVITGMIKANVPSRIAFAVSSQTDSRVILDQNGAESLLGQGDMLFSPVGSSQAPAHPGRLHRRAADRGDHRVLAQAGRARAARGPARGGRGRGGRRRRRRPDDFDPDEDPLLEEAIQLVAEMGTASTSMLQRRLRLGYTRAGRLIDMLERRGVISGYEGSKPRQVLVAPGDVAALHRAAARGDAARRTARVGRRVAFRPADAGDRGHAARGAHAPADRHHGDRGADEDPRQVPARARERGVGPPARAHVRQELPAHVRRRAGPRRRAARRGVQAAPRAPLETGELHPIRRPTAARARPAPAPRAARGMPARRRSSALVLAAIVVALLRCSARAATTTTTASRRGRHDAGARPTATTRERDERARASEPRRASRDASGCSSCRPAPVVGLPVDARGRAS